MGNLQQLCENLKQEITIPNTVDYFEFLSLKRPDSTGWIPPPMFNSNSFKSRKCWTCSDVNANSALGQFAPPTRAIVEIELQLSK